jgi:hypothetical protein
MQNLFPPVIHPSVYRHGAGFLRRVPAYQRPHGAVRYRCPVTGSFVLVTDDDALDRFVHRRVRLRCVGCGEMHLIACESEDGGVIVPQSAKS